MKEVEARKHDSPEAGDLTLKDGMTPQLRIVTVRVM
jgi:hypothetical protein